MRRNMSVTSGGYNKFKPCRCRSQIMLLRGPLLFKLNQESVVVSHMLDPRLKYGLASCPFGFQDVTRQYIALSVRRVVMAMLSTSSSGEIAAFNSVIMSQKPSFMCRRNHRCSRLGIVCFIVSRKLLSRYNLPQRFSNKAGVADGVCLE